MFTPAYASLRQFTPVYANRLDCLSFAENSPDCSSFLLKAAPVYASLRQFTPVYASLRRNPPGKLYGLINDSIMKAALRYFLIGKS